VVADRYLRDSGDVAEQWMGESGSIVAGDKTRDVENTALQILRHKSLSNLSQTHVLLNLNRHVPHLHITLQNAILHCIKAISKVASVVLFTS